MNKCIKCGSYAFNLYKEDIDQGGLCDVHYWQGRAHRAEALAQPEQEPVAYTNGIDVILAKHWTADYQPEGWEPLGYTTPPQRPSRSDIKPLTDELIAYGKTASEMMASDQTRFDAACEVLRYLKQERVPYYYLHRMLTVIHGNEEAAHGIKE